MILGATNRAAAAALTAGMDEEDRDMRVLWSVAGPLLVPVYFAIGAADGLTEIVPTGVAQERAGASQTEGRIAGHVLERGVGWPVAGAEVALYAAGQPSGLRVTNSDGAFAFDGLPRGSYSLVAVRDGFATGVVGQQWPNGPGGSIEIGSPMTRDGVVIELWRDAVISGRVVDEEGQAMVGVEVEAQRVHWLGGRRELTQAGRDLTDDRGQYRIAGLVPGDYMAVVSSARLSFSEGVATSNLARLGSLIMLGERAVQQSNDLPLSWSPDDGHLKVYDAQYYPAAEVPSGAIIVSLQSGEDRHGVDFHLASTPGVVLEGILAGPAGGVMPFTEVRLRRPDETGRGPEVARTTSDERGRFFLAGIAPGRYELRAVRIPSARSMTSGMRAEVAIMLALAGDALPPNTRRLVPPEEPTWWARTDVVVGQTDIELTVPMRPARRISGRVVLDTGAAGDAIEPGSLGISLRPINPEDLLSPIPDRVLDDGGYTTSGSPEGEYVIRLDGLPATHGVRSVVIDGEDYTGRAIQLAGANLENVVITVAAVERGMLSGVVRSGGVSATEALVLAIPAHGDPWFRHGSRSFDVGQALAAPDGHFSIEGLPAGDYVAMAIPPQYGERWQEPEVLRELRATAVPVRIDVGQVARLELERLTLR